MGLTFEAAIELDVPCERAFEALRDHPRWSEWMPPSFRPIGVSPGLLAVGARCQVAIEGMPLPATLNIYAVDAPSKLAWKGGIVGLMTGDHAFFFEPTPGGCRVRSVEVWGGIVSDLMASTLRAKVPPVNQAQLEGLRRAVRIPA